VPRRPGSVPPELAVRKTTAAITLLTRKNCPLCLVAKRVVENAARRYRLAVEEVDIDDEPQEVLDRFKDEVPVVMVDGKRRFSGHVSPALLDTILKTRKV
jgi:glutaredoxin